MANRSFRMNEVSSQVAARLAELAREMRELVFGEDGVPEWGTKFTEIEREGMSVGFELARLFMEQSVDEPEGADRGKETRTTVLETIAEEVLWEQPKTRLAKSGRAYSPQARWESALTSPCPHRCTRR